MKKALSTLVVVLLALGYWALEHADWSKLGKVGRGGQGAAQVERSTAGDYEKLDGCTLVEHRNNDGDSFHVRHGDKQYEFRLYFVDAPESKVKTYRGGDSNLERIGHQGRYFGGLSVQETTGIGAEAKKFSASLLGGRPFTVYTKWQGVYGNQRHYAFVEFDDASGNRRFLSEELVGQGLARIYTEGADLPDGTRRRTQEDKLRSIEADARKAGIGAWRFGR